MAADVSVLPSPEQVGGLSFVRIYYPTLAKSNRQYRQVCIENIIVCLQLIFTPDVGVISLAATKFHKIQNPKTTKDPTIINHGRRRIFEPTHHYGCRWH